MATIREAEGRADVAAIRLLFEQYAQSLGVDLSFQDFDQELASLPGAYAAPAGRLLLAADGARAVGCVGVRPLDDRICEMKRLYVRPEACGQGLGRRLAETAITFGKAANYHAMRLDTLPTMASAQDLYRQLGFREVAPYRYNPVPGTSFLQLDLLDAVDRDRRIAIVPYDPGWPAAFDAEARLEANDAESRERYAHAKADFIERVVALTLTMGYPRDLHGEVAHGRG
jgi:ribosomal protein S18 acetylase RimI-like enzyme